MGFFPLVPPFQANEQVGQLHAHRVGGNLGSADPAPDVIDLVGEGCQQGLLDLGIFLDRLVQVGPRQAHDIDGEGPFGERGHKFGAEIGRDYAEGQGQKTRTNADHHGFVVHRRAQNRGVNAVGDAHQERLPFLDAPGQKQAGQDGHESQGQDHRAGQGEDYRQGHRPK